MSKKRKKKDHHHFTSRSHHLANSPYDHFRSLTLNIWNFYDQVVPAVAKASNPAQHRARDFPALTK